MTLLDHPASKPASHDWIGALPAEWGSASLRWVSRRFAGGTPDRSNTSFWTNGTIPWINSGAVNQAIITEPSTMITADAFASSSARWIPAGSVVIALAGQGKTKGTVAYLAIDSTCNQSMAAIIPDDASIKSRYLYWWLQSQYQNIRNMAGGDLRDGLNLEHIGSIRVPLPPQRQQREIVDFLDRETAKIDELINKQEQLIATLREDRAATITQAVTKGLDPGVETKDPDVEWADEIPADWHITPFLRCMEGRVDYRGATPKKVDAGTTLITARNVRPGLIDYAVSEEHVSADDYAEIMRRGLPEIDDILFTMEAPLGHVALVDRTDVALAQRIIKFRADRSIATPRFLMYSVMNSGFQFQLKARATGSTALGLKASKLPELQVAIPSSDEQEAITHFLDDRCAKIDALIDKSTEMIEALREYRSALITNAVTGKIDVREAV